MNHEEANAVLAKYGYVPGVSSTADIEDEPRRSEIKAACQALKHPEVSKPVAVKGKK